MIVPMKKIYLIVQNKDLVGALESLRDLGVVHIEREQTPEGGMIPRYKEDIRKIESACHALRNCRPAEIKTTGNRFTGGRFRTNRMSEIKQTVDEILHVQSEIESLEEHLAALEADIQAWEPWGNFNPADVKALRQHGAYLYLTQIADIKKVVCPDGVRLHRLGDSKSNRYLAVAENDRQLPFETVGLPEASLAEMKDQRKKELQRLESMREKMAQYALSRNPLEKTLKELLGKLSFEEVVRGARTEGDVSILKGFCPENQVDECVFRAEQERWGFAVEDPSEEDRTPTLLENPAWVKPVRPILNFMMLTPGYHEIDISVIFLVFSIVFFGMLIGDAGYGLLFLGITFWAHRKFGPKIEDQAIFYLSYALNSWTVVWGFLTGVFFGTVLFGQWIKPLVPWLTDNNHVQLLCFVIGAVHLSIGHLWNAFLKRRSLGSLAEIGWICILWYFVFIANLLILGGEMFSWMHVMFGIGAGFAFLFNAPRETLGGTLKAAGGDAVINFLGMIGFFGDILSYIRLFAVGLAGVAVADAFSSMAVSVGFKSPGAIAGALLILLAGHSLNLVLVLFGFMVHGIRLNLLEFSSHVGVGWSGVPYQPLKLNSSHSK